MTIAKSCPAVRTARRARLPLALGLLLLLIPAAARAELGIEITPFGGLRLGGSFRESATGESLRIDESAAFGLVLGLQDTPSTQYELLYSFQGTNLTGSETPGISLPGLDVHYLHLGGTYETSQEGVRPFVSAGVGLTHLVADGGDSSTDFSFSLGGGVKVPLSDRVGLRLEGRGYLTIFTNSAEVFCVAGGGAACAFSVEGDALGQVELLAGIYFRL